MYAVRVGELVKIGHTGNMAQRFAVLKPDEILGFRPGTYYDEQRVHEKLQPHLARGREWYHVTPEVLEVVNSMRAEIGLEDLAA